MTNVARRPLIPALLCLSLAALLSAAAVSSPAAQGDPNDMQARDRKRSAENLKQIGVALHAYAAANKTLPPPALCDLRKGKPLLSWRVAILPYLEQDALYKEFKLNEPWDGPNNKKLLAKMPAVYAPVGVKTRHPHATFYQAIVGGGAAWEQRPDKKAARGALGMPLASFTDGLSTTILVVEAWDPVPWTKPQDVPYNPKKPLPKLGGPLRNGFNVLLADGSVRFLPKRINDKLLRALITRSGGETIDVRKIP